MAQKTQDDEPLDLQPLDLQPIDEPTPTPQSQSESFLNKAWRTISEAPEFITKPVHEAGMALTEHSLDESMLGSQLRGFGAGALDAIAGMITPLNIASMGKGPLLGQIARGAGALQTAHGAYDLSQGNIGGAADVGFGILGMKTPIRGQAAERLLDLHNKDLAKGLPELPRNTSPDIVGNQPVRPMFNPKGQTGMTGSMQAEMIDPLNIKNNPDWDINTLNDLRNELKYTNIDLSQFKNADEIQAYIDERDIKAGAKTMGDYAKEAEQNIRSNMIIEGTPLKKLTESTGLKPTAKIITTDTAATVQRLAKEGYQPGGVTPDGYPYMVKNGKQIPLDDPEMPGTPEEKASVGAELYNFARGLSTSWDLSAPLRQGLPLIGTRAFWRALPDMVRALGEKGAYDLLINDIKSRPLFKEDYEAVFSNGQWVKKRIPSYAEKAGLAITDLKTLKNREENLMSTWAEKVPFGIGRGVKASNRAYTVFLNKLRADHFETLIRDAKGMELDPENNLALGKEIADFVNTATGRGPLRTYRPTLEGGKETSILGINFNSHLKESSVEESAKKLTHLLFSPRLVASRIRMLNPATYIAANPFVRKQYLKSMLHTAGAWTAVAGMAKMAGADVVLDPTNSDFGKIKIGNTRLDPAAGFQQYLVLASRLMMGKTTPSTRPNRPREFGKGYQAPTRASVAEDFTVNKLHPVLKFAYDLYDASEYKPVQMGDRILQMYVPLVIQDVVELAKEDPKLISLSILTGLGMGTQTYQKGEQGSFAIPPSLDYTYKGGSPF